MKHYTFKLAGIMIVAFIIQQIFPIITSYLVIDSLKPFELWRYLAAIFIHANTLHLILNLFGLLLFGFILEKEIGSKRFLYFFIFTGLISSVVSVLFYTKVLGASGAVFGIIGMLAVLKPTLVVWAYSVPMPLFIAAIIWATADILGIFFPENTANIGHISGLAAGILIGVYLRIKNPKIKLKKEKIKIPEEDINEWEQRYMQSNT